MILKFLSAVSVLFLWFLAGNLISPANGENACSNCYPFNECQVSYDGWAAAPNAEGDQNLVVRSGPYGHDKDHKLARCMNEEYRLTGDVLEYVCFWKSPYRCEAVVPHYNLHNVNIMRRICSDCTSYCGCENGPSLKIDRGLIIISVCFVWVVAITRLY